VISLLKDIKICSRAIISTKELGNLSNLLAIKEVNLEESKLINIMELEAAIKNNHKENL
jgi:hypothetical protein